eukprot:CAMPEP_0203684056 /NCGR_PEP_ID=MMETSP0090-20130426/47834_1 /ASSEMBLY_ACC=CAM_ASM_001088 /TAXON_ID=426623 /ORGANISM="Chaetoceros affinis, Strain CCMP159" /LENGTH=334 /DNA_ID=CAMNT_0050553217 /DNA_START=51 /DNA_END=1055 /DNA_ORIENTATION=+
MDSQDSPTPYPELPNPRQNWAHSTCSVEELSNALNDPEITAIESDIVCGSVVSDNGISSVIEPIMAHPPSKHSDLSFQMFFEMSTTNDRSINTPSTSSSIKKHLKLDFKEIEAVGPVLDILSQKMFQNNVDNSSDGSHQKTIYFNADIIHGPGLRNASLSVHSDEFMKICLQFLKQDLRRQKQCAFSLGWKSDCRSFTGYTKNDIKKIKDIIQSNDLLSCSQGVVLAANARVLVRDPHPFDSILKEIPEIQLLVWTGTGEPPISAGKIKKIKNHFQEINCMHQVGFDCQIAESFLSGLLYDSAVEIAGLLWNAQHYLEQKIDSMRYNTKILKNK